MSEITNEAIEQEAALVEQVEQQHEQLETFSKADLEEIARENGWKEDGPKDALTFMKDGGVYRRQHVNTIKDLQDQVSRMETVLAEQVFRTVKSEEQQLKDQIKNAVDEGDSTKAIELTERLRAINQPVVKTDPTEIYNRWIQENKWYSDPDLKGLADDIHDAEKARMGQNFDPAKVLAKVTEKMQRHLPKPTNQNRERGTAEAGGKRSTGTGELSVRDLTPEEAAHFDDFRKAGIAEKTLLKSIAKARSMA